MSPEMARLYRKTLIKEEINYKQDLVSYESDLYSLGILLMEMLMDKSPVGYLDGKDATHE